MCGPKKDTKLVILNVWYKFDNQCNQCTFANDGGFMKIGACTDIRCPGGKQKTGLLCSVALNNCGAATIFINDPRYLSIDICTKDVRICVFKIFSCEKYETH